MKKKTDNPQFPKISRFFTETKKRLDWDKKRYIIYIFTAIFLLFIAFMIFDLRQKVILAQNLEIERSQIKKEIGKWEEIVKQYKDYRDGYLKLAILEYKLGDFNKARKFLDKALVIDPNSKEGRDLEENLIDKH